MYISINFIMATYIPRETGDDVGNDNNIYDYVRGSFATLRHIYRDPKEAIPSQPQCPQRKEWPCLRPEVSTMQR